MKLVRRTENSGPNEALRFGVKTADGDYVLFLDGDDMLARDVVENLCMKADDTEADILTAPAFIWSLPIYHSSSRLCQIFLSCSIIESISQSPVNLQ